MEMAQNIASILGEDPKKLEKDSLKIYLSNRLKEIDSNILTITKRYGIKDIFEMDDKLKKGELTEDCLEEYQELDSLEAQKDQTNRVEGHVVEGIASWGPFRFKALHLPSGSSASILFRPNDVYVTSKKEHGGWPGEIQSVQFLGATEAIEIQREEKIKLIAHVPRGIAKLSGFATGGKVYVLISAAHVYPGSS